MKKHLDNSSIIKCPFCSKKQNSDLGDKYTSGHMVGDWISATICDKCNKEFYIEQIVEYKIKRSNK